MPCTNRHKVVLFLLFSVAYSFFYIYPNFWPPSPPLQLPLTWLDRAIPFLPWTFYIYLSVYALYVFVILWIKDLDQFNAFSRRTFLTLSFCGVFFLLYPTTYPRPVYPTHQPFLIEMVLRLMTVADNPTNCFPSMHVSMASAAAYSVHHLGAKRFRFVILWTLAIFASTLTTKQHYVVDIMGGLGVTVLMVCTDWTVFDKAGLYSRLKTLSLLKKRAP